MAMSILVIGAHSSQQGIGYHIYKTIPKLDTPEPCTFVSHWLNEENFDPVLDQAELRRNYSFDSEVQTHIKDLEKADRVIFIYPDWWGLPPASLKGWIDRIFRQNVAYSTSEKGELIQSLPLLGKKKAYVIISTDHSYSPSLITSEDFDAFQSALMENRSMEERKSPRKTLRSHLHRKDVQKAWLHPSLFFWFSSIQKFSGLHIETLQFIENPRFQSKDNTATFNTELKENLRNFLTIS